MVNKNWKAIASHDGCDVCPATESITHLVLRCKAADVLWKKIGVLDLAVQANSLLEFVSSPLASYRIGKLWHVLFAVCAVTLWSARNA